MPQVLDEARPRSLILDQHCARAMAIIEVLCFMAKCRMVDLVPPDVRQIVLVTDRVKCKSH